MGASKTSDNKTLSDKSRDVAAANPGRDMTSADVHKFDRAADNAAIAQSQPLYTTKGQHIETQTVHKRRIAAQIASYRKKRGK